ncbi:hypothetical protein [Agromyces salentinus]|uniref:Uncharacterized protein n=1 Tax=Agromyces salentinus TaxID=269421 RepID=A0ABN2MGS3_9MICO|nr:hypothetical protein [Agromyces salentinus]
MTWAHRQLLADDASRLRLIAAWEDVRAKLTVAARGLESFDASRGDFEAALNEVAPDLEKLDAAIHAAVAAGISDMGIALESSIELRLARHVVSGGTSLAYFDSKYESLKLPRSSKSQ